MPHYDSNTVYYLFFAFFCFCYDESPWQHTMYTEKAAHSWFKSLITCEIDQKIIWTKRKKWRRGEDLGSFSFLWHHMEPPHFLKIIGRGIGATTNAILHMHLFVSIRNHNKNLYLTPVSPHRFPVITLSLSVNLQRLNVELDR